MSVEKNDGLICISLKDNDGRKVKDSKGIYQSLSKSTNFTIVSADNNRIIVRIEHLPTPIDSVAPKVKFVAINKKEGRKESRSTVFHRRNGKQGAQREDVLLDVSGFLVKA